MDRSTRSAAPSGPRRSARASSRAALAVAAVVSAAVARLAFAQDAAPAAPPAPLAPEAEAPAATPAPDETPGEEIVVTATRSPRRIRDVPAAVTVLNHGEIERSPTKTADELLRIDPSFGLFRRSSSVAADPSSQGVKLRNVAASAVSRALVLVDGIPENDAYAGWVAWRAIPRLALSRVEVVPGGGSALYGNYALGGVIQAFSRPIAPREGELSAEYGSFNTAVVAGHASDVWGPVGAALDGELFRSDGYVVAAPCPPLTTAGGPPEQCRGPVDTATPSEHAAIRGRLEAQATPNLSFDLRGAYFWEDLNGGTEHTTASMRRLELAGGAHWLDDTVGAVDLVAFAHKGEFFQDRARVTLQNNVRVSEVLAGHQDVPSDDLGASAVWQSRPLRLAGSHVVVLGTDARWVHGTLNETSYPPAPPVTQREVDAKQRLYGVFAQDLWDFTSAFGASLALRWDRWENLSTSRVDTAGTTVTTTPFPDRSGDEWSPKVGLHGRFAEWLSVRAAAYGSFRAATLDELYRPFQVGTIRTDSNPDLTPETLVGYEGGVDLGMPRGPTLRVTGFWNELRDPILNVTTGPTTRQKQNLGTARIDGVEAEARWPFLRRWAVVAAYTFAPTKVTSAPGQPQLEGKQLPQSPKSVATGTLSFDHPRLVTASAQVRYVADQYENDVNTQPLGDAWLLDLFAAWHATRFLDVFVAVENLLDKTYYVGRSGLDTVGQPLFVHGGVRIQGG